MPFAAFLPIAGALLNGLGGLFGHKAKQKQQQEAARLAREAAVRGWDQREMSRIAALKSLQGIGGAHGPKVQALLSGLDPSIFIPRPYTGQELPKETGNSTLGGILGGAGGVATAAGDYFTQKEGQASRQNATLKMLCALVPSLPDCQAKPGAVPSFGDEGEE